MRISLHGAYYDPNFGDILLMKMFTQWIKEYNREIVINYPRINKSIIRECPEPSETGIMNLLRSNGLIFFGGGYFGEPNKRLTYWSLRNIYKYCYIAFVAILFRIPYSIIAVEFGPISKWWLKYPLLFIFRHAKLIAARNKESLFFLESNGIKNAKLSYDCVLSLSDIIPPSKKKQGVLLHIPHLNTTNEHRFILFSQLLAKELKNKKIDNITLIEDEISSRDDNRYNKILKNLKESGIACTYVPYKNTEVLIQLINTSEFVITTKLHVGISAAALNTKVLSLYGHQKTKRLHSQIGNEKFCIAIECINKQTSTIIKDFFEQKDFFLPKECKDLSCINKKYLNSFLENIK